MTTYYTGKKFDNVEITSRGSAARVGKIKCSAVSQLAFEVNIKNSLFAVIYNFVHHE